MNTADRTVYRSRIDAWVWIVLVLTVGLTVAICIGAVWWMWLIPVAGIITPFVGGMAGCRYVIEGDTLVVYQFFRPHRLPVMKIRSVRRTTGYLATAGMSCRRVTIRFTDRSVLRSSMPLEISPADRDGFIRHLCEINPHIEVLA